jgi:serine/threonine-protein kinase RsbW
MIKSERSEYSGSLSVDTVEKREIKFQSDSGRIRETSSKILRDISCHGLGDSTAFEIKLCIEEAVRNAIVHGNKSDPKRQVRISYWVKDGVFNIEIEDDGKGFDHEAVKDPTKEENLLRNSGRGVYLIKKLMDNVRYNEAGNKISMSKKIK